MGWTRILDAESTVKYLLSIGKSFEFIIQKLMDRLQISFDDAYEYYQKYSK